MRVMVDSNIIVSAALFPRSTVAKVFEHIIDNHVLVLSKYTIDEVEDVFAAKFPHKISELQNFVAKLPHEVFTIKNVNAKKYPSIRDSDDLPVLANAIESNVDLLITGDKDFDDVIIKKPKIIKPRNYIDDYVK